MLNMSADVSSVTIAAGANADVTGIDSSHENEPVPGNRDWLFISDTFRLYALAEGDAGRARSSLAAAIKERPVAMRLYEMGIDQAQDVLADDPRNKEALRMLAELYERNGRNAPALAALCRLALIEPQDQGVRERIRLLTR